MVFIVDNDSTGNITVVDNASTTLDTVVGGSIDNWVLLDNSTTAGTWVAYSSLPSTYDFGTSSASFGSATITSAVWNGTTIASGYGGTGLTTFTAANNAIYSTSASALAAGTLPTAAGGTALTSFTANGALYATSTSALTTGTLPIASGGTNSTATPTAGGVGYGTGTAHAYTAAGTSGQYLTSGGAGAPTWVTLPSNVSSISFGTTGLTPSTATTGAVTVAGTLNVANGGTGLTTFTAANYALYSTSSSALTAGTLPVAAGGTGSTSLTANNVLLGNGTSALQAVAPGTSGNILTSNGTTWTSAAPAAATLTITSTTSNTNYNLGFQSASSGTTSTDYVNTSFTANPSTGAMTAPNVVASNGLLVHSKTVSTSYSIPSGSNAIAAGPMTVAAGAAVTIPSGSRWLVL